MRFVLLFGIITRRFLGALWTFFLIAIALGFALEEVRVAVSIGALRCLREGIGVWSNEQLPNTGIVFVCLTLRATGKRVAVL